MSGLLDTGFLLAVVDADDALHESCLAALLSEPAPILPDVVIPELAYLILRKLGYPVLINFLNSITNGELLIEHLEMKDLSRTTEILAKYADNKVDFVDCDIIAMAERLNIQRILTVENVIFKYFVLNSVIILKLYPPDLTISQIK